MLCRQLSAASTVHGNTVSAPDASAERASLGGVTLCASARSSYPPPASSRSSCTLAALSRWMHAQIAPSRCIRFMRPFNRAARVAGTACASINGAMYSRPRISAAYSCTPTCLCPANAESAITRQPSSSKSFSPSTAAPWSMLSAHPSLTASIQNDKDLTQPPTVESLSSSARSDESSMAGK